MDAYRIGPTLERTFTSARIAGRVGVLSRKGVLTVTQDGEVVSTVALPLNASSEDVWAAVHCSIVRPEFEAIMDVEAALKGEKCTMAFGMTPVERATAAVHARQVRTWLYDMVEALSPEDQAAYGAYRLAARP